MTIRQAALFATTSPLSDAAESCAAGDLADNGLDVIITQAA